MSDLAKRANDFEEEHGWCPDYGYEVYDNQAECEESSAQNSTKCEEDECSI